MPRLQALARDKNIGKKVCFSPPQATLMESIRTADPELWRKKRKLRLFLQPTVFDEYRYMHRNRKLNYVQIYIGRCFCDSCEASGLSEGGAYMYPIRQWLLRV